MKKIILYCNQRFILSQVILLLALQLPLKAQVNLVSQIVRNGSFEDTVLSPWSVGLGNSSVNLDSSFSSHGNWHAVISQTANSSIVRPSIYQSLSANRIDGTFFSLAFDARNGLSGFAGVRVTLAAQNGDSSYALATNSFFNLSYGGWQSFEKSIAIPSNWDGGGNLFIGFQFERQGAVTGANYTGYLDNIVLTQIPEPTSLSLLSLSAGLVVLAQKKHRANQR